MNYDIVVVDEVYGTNRKLPEDKEFDSGRLGSYDKVLTLFNFAFRVCKDSGISKVGDLRVYERDSKLITVKWTYAENTLASSDSLLERFDIPVITLYNLCASSEQLLRRLGGRIASDRTGSESAISQDSVHYRRACDK